MRPMLLINGVDYTRDAEELTPVGNGLNADGSGRDIQTGEMFRTKIGDKLTFAVKMLPLNEARHQVLAASLKESYYQATLLDPDTDTVVTKTFYTDTRPFGVQRYDPWSGQTIYDGMAFNMIEK